MELEQAKKDKKAPPAGVQRPRRSWSKVALQPKEADYFSKNDRQPPVAPLPRGTGW